MSREQWWANRPPLPELWWLMLRDEWPGVLALFVVTVVLCACRRAACRRSPPAPAQLERGQFGRGKVVLVAAGGEHTVVLADDKALWVRGYGGRGELGLGDTNDKLAPTRPAQAPLAATSTTFRRRPCARSPLPPVPLATPTATMRVGALASSPASARGEMKSTMASPDPAFTRGDTESLQQDFDSLHLHLAEEAECATRVCCNVMEHRISAAARPSNKTVEGGTRTEHAVEKSKSSKTSFESMVAIFGTPPTSTWLSATSRSEDVDQASMLQARTISLGRMDAEDARRSRRDRTAVDKHNRQAIAEADEHKRNDVETVQSAIKPARRRRGPVSDTRASMMTSHDMLPRRTELHQLHPPSSTPGPTPPVGLTFRRVNTAARPTQRAPAGPEPVELPAGADRALARPLQRMTANTTSHAPPTPMGFRAFRAPDLEPVELPGPAGAARALARPLQRLTANTTSHAPPTPMGFRTFSAPLSQVGRTAAPSGSRRHPSRWSGSGGSVTDYTPVDGSEELGKRYKAVWSIEGH